MHYCIPYYYIIHYYLLYYHLLYYFATRQRPLAVTNLQKTEH